MRPSEFQEQFSAANPTTLVPGALRGYRQWELTLDLRLKSVSHDCEWDPTMQAECHWARASASDYHVAPSAECVCGIYACHHPDDAQVSDLAVLHPGCLVNGVIEAWGKVQVGARGFRAERASVVALTFALPDHRTVWQALGDARDIFGQQRRFELPDGRVVKAAELTAYGGDVGEWRAMLRENYPGVPFYADRADMLADYPPVKVDSLIG